MRIYSPPITRPVWQACEHGRRSEREPLCLGRCALLDDRLTNALRQIPRMEVQLTPDQEAFVRQAIESGRLHDEQEALEEALALWEQRERRRHELLASIDSARAAHARGEGRPLTEASMQELTDEVKARGRARLAAEQPQPR